MVTLWLNPVAQLLPLKHSPPQRSSSSTRTASAPETVNTRRPSSPEVVFSAGQLPSASPDVLIRSAVGRLICRSFRAPLAGSTDDA